MTGFDYAVIAIVLLSALLGMWRGLAYEVLSLAGWVAAYWVARTFAAAAAPAMPAALGADEVRLAAAWVAVFVAALVACGVATWLLSKAVKWAGLGWLDASLGGVFGAVRGVLAVLALVLLAGLTALPQQPFWRSARLSGTLEQAALAVKDRLPSDLARQLRY